jgi:hypothetical protein
MQVQNVLVMANAKFGFFKKLNDRQGTLSVRRDTFEKAGNDLDAAQNLVYKSGHNGTVVTFKQTTFSKVNGGERDHIEIQIDLTKPCGTPFKIPSFRGHRG